MPLSWHKSQLELVKKATINLLFQEEAIFDFRINFKFIFSSLADRILVLSSHLLTSGSKVSKRFTLIFNSLQQAVKQAANGAAAPRQGFSFLTISTQVSRK